LLQYGSADVTKIFVSPSLGNLVKYDVRDTMDTHRISYIAASPGEGINRKISLPDLIFLAIVDTRLPRVKPEAREEIRCKAVTQNVLGQTKSGVDKLKLGGNINA
jgi:hypothetical protein